MLVRLSRAGYDALVWLSVREYAVLVGGTKRTVFVLAVVVTWAWVNMRRTQGEVFTATVVGTLVAILDVVR